MKFGLNPTEFELLEKLVINPLKEKSVKVFAFGSRATSKNHPFSDIDLLLEPDESNHLDSSTLSKIKEAIEESRFPIKVDFVLIDDLAESYRERVMNERVEL
jgi:predicted nucleotidyltransferase